MSIPTSAADWSRQLPALPAAAIEVIVLQRVLAACATGSAVLAAVAIVRPSPILIAILMLAVAATPLARLVEGDDQRWLPWVMVIVANCAVVVASAAYR